MADLTRFGISIDERLLQQFDELINSKGVKHGKLVATTTGQNLL